MIKNLYRYLEKHTDSKLFLFRFKTIKIFLNMFLPLYFLLTPRKKLDEESTIVVSLTSFPARIKRLHVVIECILRQTSMPHKIVLYLSKEQFRNFSLLPLQLRKLCNQKYLEIELVEGDIRSHKKYLYAMSTYKDFDIVTIDDDIIYPEDMIEGLLAYHTIYNTDIICNLAHKIVLDDNNEVMPYRAWKKDMVSLKSKYSLVPIGCGGVFYPKRCMLETDVLNIDRALELCPNADDFWLKINSLLSGRKVFRSMNYKKYLFTDILFIHNQKLCDSNVTENKNDIQFKSLYEFYKNRISVYLEEMDD